MKPDAEAKTQDVRRTPLVVSRTRKTKNATFQSLMFNDNSRKQFDKKQVRNDLVLSLCALWMKKRIIRYVYVGQYFCCHASGYITDSDSRHWRKNVGVVIIHPHLFPWIPKISVVVIVINSGGSMKLKYLTRHPQSIFLHFYAVFVNIWPNNRPLPFLSGAPHLGNPGSASDQVRTKLYPGSQTLLKPNLTRIVYM